MINGTSTASLTESDAVQTAAGQLTISDVDSATTFVAQTAVNGNNGFGKFSVDATGKWAYVMNNAHNEFSKDVGYTDSLNVASADGTIKTITVTMMGTNDAAIIGGISTANMTESDAVQTTGGQLTVSDVDNTPATFIAQSSVNGVNGFGSFSIDANGKWTYVMNSAHDEFAVGKNYTDSVTITSLDGTPQTITVTILGTNDLAVIGGNTASALTESNAAQTAYGQLTATDVDNVPVADFVAQTAALGVYGNFSVDVTGKWSYTMGSSQDELVGGVTYTDSFTVRTADGASKVVTVSILGTDDTSTISGSSTSSLTETNEVLTTSGKLLSSDIDSPVAASFVAQTGTAGDHGFGHFSLDATGQWTYTANSAHDEFKAGVQYTDSFTAVTADGTSQTVTVTIAGTNDAAVIGGTSVLSMTENNVPQSTRAGLTVSDIDSAAEFVPITVEGTAGMGSFSLDSSGQWTYAMSGPQDKLVEGVSYTDTAVVTTADGTTQTLQVNITGTDDLSIVGGNSAVTITENNDAQIVTSALTVTDVDGLAAFVPQTDVLGSNGYGNWQAHYIKR